MSTLVHPQMLAALADFYPSLCTFQDRSADVDMFGAPHVNAYGVPDGVLADVAGLIGLACSVNRPPSNQAQEVRLPDKTVVRAPHRIALAGYYPTITTAMVAVVGGITYNVLSVAHDAQGASTWVLVELVTT